MSFLLRLADFTVAMRDAALRHVPLLTAVLLTVALLTVALPCVAVGPPVLTLSNPQGPIQSLEIGDDFYVSVSGLAPGQSVILTLSDDFGRSVEQLTGKADALGNIESVPLWPWTGVVGCDEGVVSDPAAYRFVDFNQADAFLQGRVFTVTVHDGNENLLVSRTLPLVSTGAPRHFYSDAAGCPRLDIDRSRGEDLYLTVQNVDLTQQHMAIFLVDAQQPPGPNSEILDVRFPFQGSNPQVIPQGSGRSWTQLLWTAADSRPGPYIVILHFFKLLPERYYGPGHLPLIPNRGKPGVTISPWECRKCDD